MTTPNSNTEALRAALEQYAANMTTDEFRAFIMRVRPPAEANQLITTSDPADRSRAMTASIAAKQAKRPTVDTNGHPIRTDPNYLNKLKGYQTP